MKTIYLDHAATTPLTDKVKSCVINLLDNFYNPSSAYQSGVDAKRIMEQSRHNVAKFINANDEDIIFTSGGSASNTLAIRGYTEKHDCIVYYSPLLHKSALSYLDSGHTCNRELPVDKDGFIDVRFLEKEMNLKKSKPFVVIEYASSELGTIQPVKEIIDIVHKWNGIVYLDCTGSISTIPIDVKALDISMIGFAGHKIGALKGCGILYKKPEIKLEPLIYGAQEHGLFAGTENMIGIAAMGKAVENYDYSSISSESRDYVHDYLIHNVPDCYLVGAPFNNRLPHNLYMCFQGVSGEALMTLLDMNGIQVSTGSACNAGNLKPSSTLLAIRMNEDDIHSCIRLTFSGFETKDELSYICETIKNCVYQLRMM